MLESDATLSWVYPAILLLILLVGALIIRRSGGQTTVKCRDCGEEWETGTNRCPNCGADLSPGMETNDTTEQIRF